jgi:biopolymer transport protein ExbD
MASSKLRDASTEPESECALDMSPMIDMVFLLLIFFIVNCTAIIVKTDPLVRPPIAANSKRQEDGSGRIVINIRNDGTYRGEELNVVLADEDDIYDLVKTQREKQQALGVTSKLHLRGDKEAVFKYCRTAIRGAARAGVDQVVFGVLVRQP